MPLDLRQSYGSVTISGDKFMRSLDEHKKKALRQAFLQQAEGLDYQTARAKAAKEGLITDPEVIAFLGEKNLAEKERKKTQEKGRISGAISGRFQLPPDQAGPVEPAAQYRTDVRQRLAGQEPISEDTLSEYPGYRNLPESQQAVEDAAMKRTGSLIDQDIKRSEAEENRAEAELATRKARRDARGEQDPVKAAEFALKNYELSTETLSGLQKQLDNALANYADYKGIGGEMFFDDQQKKDAEKQINDLRKQVKAAKELQKSDREYLDQMKSRIPGGRQAPQPQPETSQIDPDVQAVAEQVVSAAPPMGGSTNEALRRSQQITAVAGTLTEMLNREYGVQVTYENVLAALNQGVYGTEGKSGDDITTAVAKILMFVKGRKRPEGQPGLAGSQIPPRQSPVGSGPNSIAGRMSNLGAGR